MRGGRWGAGPARPIRAENRCREKARKPGGSCRRPVCSQCSNVCPKCSLAWLCEECVAMEGRSCQRIAIQEWAEILRQDRELLRAASAHLQRIIFEAQENMEATEEAQRMFAVSEVERQAMARKVEHEKTIIEENAQEQIQHAEANVAGSTEEAQRRHAQEDWKIESPEHRRTTGVRLSAEG
eukprot:4842860-Pyramimonas_sp.AAC.1